MMYKKLALTAALALLLCGCSAQNTESTAEPAETAAVTEAAAEETVAETAEETAAETEAAAEADSSEEEMDEFQIRKAAAEANALSYTGIGYEVVSSEALPSNDNDNPFKVVVAPVGSPDLAFPLYVDAFACMTEKEWLGEFDSDDVVEFFAAKRVAELSVSTRVGDEHELVSSESLPNNDEEDQFKIGVCKKGTTEPVEYYYASKTFCMSEEEYTAQ